MWNVKRGSLKIQLPTPNIQFQIFNIGYQFFNIKHHKANCWIFNIGYQIFNIKPCKSGVFFPYCSRQCPPSNIPWGNILTYKWFLFNPCWVSCMQFWNSRVFEEGVMNNSRVLSETIGIRKTYYFLPDSCAYFSLIIIKLLWANFSLWISFGGYSIWLFLHMFILVFFVPFKV